MTDYQLVTKLVAEHVRGVEFNQDDSLVAVYGEQTYIGKLDGTALFKGKFKEEYEKFYWNLTKEHVRDLTLSDAIWAPDGKHLYGIAGGDVYQFATDVGHFRRIFTPGEDKRFQLGSIALNKQKQILLVAGKGGDPAKQHDIFLVDFDGKLIRSFSSGHTKGVSSILFSPDGSKFFSTGVDYFLRVWDTGTGQKLDEIKITARSPEIEAIINNNLIVMRGSGHPVYSFDDAGKLTFVKEFPTVQKNSADVLGHYRSKPLLVATGSNHDRTTLCAIDIDGKTVTKIPVGLRVERVQEGNNHDILAVILQHQQAPPEVRFYSTELRSTFITEKPGAAEWVVDSSYSKIKAHYCLVPYPKYPGKWIAVSYESINVYDADFKEALKVKPERPINCCDFHSQTQMAIYYRSDNQICIIDFNVLELDKFDPHRPIESHRVPVNSRVMDLKWNHSGDKLAGVTEKHEFIIWNASLAEVVRVPIEGRGDHVAWSADDTLVAIGTDKSICYYFDVAQAKITLTVDGVGIGQGLGVVWNAKDELILCGGGGFVYIFSKEGFLLRKLDFRRESRESIRIALPTCSPTTSEIAFWFNITREGEFLYIVDQDKPIRECVTTRLHHHTKQIQFIEWLESNHIITMGQADGLALWTRK
ncbi:MAG: Pre-mRNA-processing factor 17 [Promethearchaeota archaeon CR_4]|nr:MAG: Pre-mRNA-processing factor 17 [Candidatus Lokiarchaeota archaeon CR_4]